MIELALSTGDLIQLKPAPIRKFPGRLPGCALLMAEGRDFVIWIQQVQHKSFSLTYRSIDFANDQKLNTTELIKGYRLEAVLSGELRVRFPGGEEINLLPGQYHITNSPVFQSQFSANQPCKYFSVYYTPELVAELDLADPVENIQPRPMPTAMRELVYEILQNPYDNNLRSFYYKNAINCLLFLHLSTPPYVVPGDLSPKKVAAIYEVDRYLAENLDSQITLKGLAKMAGTNTHFLKKAYERVFGISLFTNLLQRRMERAKFLLEMTDKPLKDICELAGYRTVAGFITEFRKRFGMTPNEWRRNRSGQ